MEFIAALALGWLEWTFLAVFFLCLILGTSLDRQGREGPKWIVFGIGVLVVAGYYWQNLDLSNFWTFITSWALWKPVVVYLAVGLGYSVIEFILNVRKSARHFADLWKSHMAQTFDFTVRDAEGNPVMEHKLDPRTDKPVFAEQQVVNGRGQTESVPVMIPKLRKGTVGEAYRLSEGDRESKLWKLMSEKTNEFVRDNRGRGRIIEVQRKEGELAVEPHVNRLELASHISAWTILWPAYAFSLVLGDLLTEVFRVLADFFANLSGRFVRLSFANVFKF